MLWSNKFYKESFSNMLCPETPGEIDIALIKRQWSIAILFNISRPNIRMESIIVALWISCSLTYPLTYNIFSCRRLFTPLNPTSIMSKVIIIH